MSKYFESRLSKRLGLLLFACMFFVALGYAQNASAVVRVSAGVTYQSGGYDLLTQYGEWMRVPPYGVVWCPYVDASWAPFYDGRWIRTGGGWAWDSYEPFGEIVYHYGYWYNEPEIGWFWVPGDEWSPARVQWYTYGSYCGWAPLPPPNYYWPDPWDSYGFNIWVVVNINDFCDDHIGRRGIDRPRYRDIFQHKGGFKHAPDFQQVETATHRQIPVRTITERPMDIRTDRIKIAERSATRRDAQAREAAPARQSVRSQREAVQSRRQTATPAVIRQSERKVAAQRANSQPQREVVAPRQNAQPRREVAASSRTARVERKAETAASRQPARVERKAEAPARSAQSTQSRNVEKRSDRAADTREKR
jgi:hypothetical protein